MTKNQLIYGGVGAVFLAGGSFLFFSNNSKTPELNLEKNTVNNNQKSNNEDIFAHSMLSKAEIEKIQQSNPALIQQLQNSYQNKPVQTIDSSVSFVQVPEQKASQQYSVNAPAPIDYSKFNVVSTNPSENNRKLAELQREADRKYKERAQRQQQEFNKIYKDSSQPDFGNNLKVPKEQILFFKNLKQQEFEGLMKTLNQILPTHPNKANLEKQVASYKEYYAKLQSSIDNNNVTYGMLLQHDAQHKKIVQQVHQIHNSFVGYTNNLYKNQFLSEESDAAFDKKNAPVNPANVNNNNLNNNNNSNLSKNSTQNVAPNPSAARVNNPPQVAPNPSAAKPNSNQNTNTSPTGNAFR